MAEAIVPNGIKVEHNATQNGIPIVNRYYVTQTTPVGSGDLDDTIIEALAFFNAIKGGLHPSYVLQNITATDVSVLNGTQTILPLTTANVGTGGGTAAAANAALCCSLRTNQIGRSFRGRMYFGGLLQNSLTTAQNWEPSYVAGFADALADFMTALGAINKTLVVVSRWASGVQRVVALATEIISIVADTKVDSQRRRTAN